jgi:hypothetical protein
MPNGFSEWVFNDESGAVTVDWTVLTASVVGLGLAAAAAVNLGVSSLGSDISNALSASSVATQASGCDWVCAYSGFMMAEEPGFTPEEFGGSLAELAQGRLDEFNGYDTPMLMAHLDALTAQLSNPDLPDAYRTYYEAEQTAVQGILSTR